MKIYEEVVIDMNPESSTYGEHLSEESYDYEGDIALAGGKIGDLTHRPGGYRWQKSKEWEDPSTGVTYETQGRTKKGGLFGMGSRYQTDEAKIKGKGLGGESILGEQTVKTGSPLGKQMIAQGAAAGAKSGTSAPGLDYSGSFEDYWQNPVDLTNRIMGDTTELLGGFGLYDSTQDFEWAPDKWLKGLEKTKEDRWKPVAPRMKFDMSDPESIKRWIRNISPGGREAGGDVEGWFSEQAKGLKSSMANVDLQRLVTEKGDIFEASDVSEDQKKFLNVARGLGESIKGGSAFDPTKHGGQFLKYVTGGEGLLTLLDQMKGRLASYEEESGEEKEQFHREGALRGKQTREQIADIQSGPYATGRQESQIEGLLENLRAEQTKAREAYESTTSGIWGDKISDPLYQLAQNWAGVEYSPTESTLYDID